MNRVLLITLLLVVATLFSACKTTYLLKEDFSGDVIGTRPLKNIPGDPAGDSVAYTSVINPRLAVQASTVSSGRKALVFSEASISGETAFNQWLSFKGVVSDYQQPIWFYWTGKQRNAIGELLIDIQGVQGLWVTRLKIMPDGRLIRITNVATGVGDVLGQFTTDQTHTIIISLQPAARRYNITVFGTREGSDSNRKNVAVIAEPNPMGPVFNSAKPSINFRYQNESFTSTPAYVFESVYISRKQPD